MPARLVIYRTKEKWHKDDAEKVRRLDLHLGEQYPHGAVPYNCRQPYREILKSKIDWTSSVSIGFRFWVSDKISDTS